MIREYQESDRAWAEAYMEDEFGGAFQARRGELVDVLALPGFVAEKGSRPVGIVTYRREDADCKLAFITVFERHRGVGTALLDALLAAAADCDRIWVVTTNDNLEALRFLPAARLPARHDPARSRRRVSGPTETSDRSRRRVRHPAARRARARSAIRTRERG